MRAVKHTLKAIYLSIKRTKKLFLLSESSQILELLTQFVSQRVGVRQDLLNKSIRFYLKALNRIIYSKKNLNGGQISKSTNICSDLNAETTALLISDDDLMACLSDER